VARSTFVIAALGGATALAALLVPASGAAAGDSCTAWGTLPAHVALGPHGATIHTTLRGSAACTDADLDNGATALLDGPGRSGDVSMRWAHFGASDQVTYYATVNRIGTYRLVDGDVQVYDQQSIRIPATWHESQAVVKYRGRFTRLAIDGSGVSANLEAYGRSGWASQAGVRVTLQRRAADGTWHAVARGRSTSGGRVHLEAKVRASGDYRLVSATTADTWGATRALRPAGV